MTSAAVEDQGREAITRLLARRDFTSTIYTSEAARDVAPEVWRGLMPLVRQVAVSMARAGDIEITQGGRVLSTAKPLRGPIRLRTARR